MLSDTLEGVLDHPHSESFLQRFGAVYKKWRQCRQYSPSVGEHMGEGIESSLALLLRGLDEFAVIS